MVPNYEGMPLLEFVQKKQTLIIRSQSLKPIDASSRANPPVTSSILSLLLKSETELRATETQTTDVSWESAW